MRYKRSPVTAISITLSVVRVTVLIFTQQVASTLLRELGVHVSTLCRVLEGRLTNSHRFDDHSVTCPRTRSRLLWLVRRENQQTLLLSAAAVHTWLRCCDACRNSMETIISLLGGPLLYGSNTWANVDAPAFVSLSVCVLTFLSRVVVSIWVLYVFVCAFLSVYVYLFMPVGASVLLWMLLCGYVSKFVYLCGTLCIVSLSAYL